MHAWEQSALTNLNRILANIYPMKEDGVRIAKSIDLSLAQIGFNDKAINNWFAIIQSANQRQKVDALVNFAMDENPGDEALRAAKDHAPPAPIEGPPLSNWVGSDGRGQLEKIIGRKSTLVSISSLELGLRCSKSVVRVRRKDGSSGTGFAIADNIIVTNNHVLPDAGAANESIIQFNYQKTVDGLDAQPEEYQLDSASFFRTSTVDDWTAVRFKGDGEKWGTLELKSIPVGIGDHVNIIQHPGGGQKQISFAANVILFVGGGRIQYLTDTLPGSSGSPVFDTNWNVISLHHSGGWLAEPNAASKTTYYRNEGIAIDRIIDGLGAG